MENIIKEVEPLFPSSEWNDYIGEVNKKVIALDNDREAQYQYIMKEFYKMSDERKWDKGVVVDWYKSQMHVIGNTSWLTCLILWHCTHNQLSDSM